MDQGTTHAATRLTVWDSMKRVRNSESGPARVTNGQAALILAFVSTGLLFFALGRLSPRLTDASHNRAAASWAAVPKKPDTLVVYAYANRDWEYPRNLQFFIQHGEPLRGVYLISSLEYGISSMAAESSSLQA